MHRAPAMFSLACGALSMLSGCIWNQDHSGIDDRTRYAIIDADGDGREELVTRAAIWRQADDGTWVAVRELDDQAESDARPGWFGCDATRPTEFVPTVPLYGGEGREVALYEVGESYGPVEVAREEAFLMAFPGAGAEAGFEVLWVGSDDGPALGIRPTRDEAVSWIPLPETGEVERLDREGCLVSAPGADRAFLRGDDGGTLLVRLDLTHTTQSIERVEGTGGGYEVAMDPDFPAHFVTWTAWGGREHADDPSRLCEMISWSPPRAECERISRDVSLGSFSLMRLPGVEGPAVLVGAGRTDRSWHLYVDGELHPLELPLPRTSIVPDGLTAAVLDTDGDDEDELVLWDVDSDRGPVTFEYAGDLRFERAD